MVTNHDAHSHEDGNRAYVRALKQHAPQALAAFSAFDEASLRAPGRAIPRKYTELIAVAVALTTQCSSCIDSHVVSARTAGATEQELAETVFVGAALRAGAGMSHGLAALRAYDTPTTS
ncbi:MULTISPECIES: carboxymuconolactone decarboxylase family protein [Rhodococcus]|uniref:Carboxymuconolactone decarboxylase-like domain-containing protein n=1 Tax=Rhodococcus qingshengii TaxID=334542 RepID=A0A2A5IZU0_RHOSG|nr:MULTISPECIES: carboxymuconolactone decarboxylase family protein [Rhodococcus]MDJ0105206.1 carboxymuconolactone decarboxylase family protein [Rhodococcus erythropolis]MDV8015332.1 carboxymuconolactone decarboxylase family protein [Rhodococcus sp. IEGM 1241]PCK22499.1 hypothetical protein CHR55_32280 [Rhodococcus qingshengii]